MTEQGGAGADPSNLLTKARYDGDEFVVNGRKWLITGAKGAGFVIIFADVEAANGRPGGPTMLVSDMDAEGIRLVREIDTMDNSFTNGHWEVAFENLRVPAENVLGAVSEAVFRVADRCVQILGGLGVTRDTVVEQLFREARAFRIYDGPSEVHRFAMARRLLR